MSSPYLGCDQTNTMSAFQGLGILILDETSREDNDLSGGGCPHLSTQQAYLVPDSSDRDNSQKRLVHWGPMTG